MDEVVFKQWLQMEKKMSGRSATDVISRCKRIHRMTQKDRIDDNTIGLLLEMESYSGMSSFVKSQLKRAAKLYLEFAEIIIKE